MKSQYFCLQESGSNETILLRKPELYRVSKLSITFSFGTFFSSHIQYLYAIYLLITFDNTC